MIINKGDYFQLKNKDYCVVLELYYWIRYKKNCIRFRIVKSCKGKYSKKSRIGKPYTYQSESYINNFKQRILRKVSHEEILKLLFKQGKYYVGVDFAKPTKIFGVTIKRIKELIDLFKECCFDLQKDKDFKEIKRHYFNKV